MRTPTAEVQVELVLTMTTPLSVGAAGSRGGLADKSIQRDGWNRPIVPGSQVKGRLRHACERVARALDCPTCTAPLPDRMCPDNPAVTREPTEPLALVRAEAHGQPLRQCVVCALFGSPLFPGPLSFANLIHPPPSGTAPEAPDSAAAYLRTGVGLDRRRRTALEQVLYTVETTATGLRFAGTIVGTWWETPVEEVRRLLGLLVAGTQLVTRWGGGSSRGLGWGELEVVVTLNEEVLSIDDLLTDLEEWCP